MFVLSFKILWLLIKMPAKKLLLLVIKLCLTQIWVGSLGVRFEMGDWGRGEGGKITPCLKLRIMLET